MFSTTRALGLLMLLVLLSIAPCLGEERSIESFPGATDEEQLKAGMTWVFMGPARHLVASRTRYTIKTPVVVERPPGSPLGASVIDFKYAQVVLIGPGCIKITGTSEETIHRVAFLRFDNVNIEAKQCTAPVALSFTYTVRLFLRDVQVSRCRQIGLLIHAAHDATLRDVVVMGCGSATLPALRFASGPKFLSNRVTMENCTLERSAGIALEATRVAHLVVTGGTKIHGLPNWANVGPLVVLDSCAGTQITATTLTWGDGTGSGVVLVKGDRNGSTLLDVMPQTNLKGPLVKNDNTDPTTRIIVRIPDSP